MEYRVHLNAKAVAKTTLYVDANSEEEAEQKAVNAAKCGTALWQYGRIDRGSVEVVKAKPSFLTSTTQQKSAAS